MIEIHWFAGLLAAFLLWVPLIIVFVVLYKRNKEIDRKYEENMKRIKEQHK